MSCPWYYYDCGFACRKKGDNVNEDVYYKYCRNYDYDDCPIYKGNDSGGGCFLTSACVEARGLADDCEELTLLRKFRDEYLSTCDGGKEEIEEYYRIAPGIVEKIKSQDHAISVFDRIYTDLIVPCVENIKLGNNEITHKLYRDYILKLKADMA